MGIDRRSFLSGAAALAIEQTLLPGETKADVPRHLSWREGVEWICKATEKDNVEYGDGFMSFENGRTAWSDHQYTRGGSFMRGKDYDWDTWKGTIAENGQITSYVDVHSHRFGSPPSSVDVRALLAKDLIIRKKWEADSIPATAYRSKDMKLSGLVLAPPKRQGWYYEIAAPGAIKKLLPKATPMTKPYELDDSEYSRRLSLLRKAVEQFGATMVRANFDLPRIRATPDGKQEFQNLMRLYAEVGILMKHMNSSDLEKGPPGIQPSPPQHRKK